MVDLLDALAVERVDLIDNSLGGRVALEIALRGPERIGRLALLAPSLAWRRPRRWAPALRLVRPELGLVQLAPRPIVDTVVHRLLPGADEGWVAAGVDEFLRAYLTRAGRAAFYAAARQIDLEAPRGDNGFWTRLRAMQQDALHHAARRRRRRRREPIQLPLGPHVHRRAVSAGKSANCTRLSVVPDTRSARVLFAHGEAAHLPGADHGAGACVSSSAGFAQSRMTGSPSGLRPFLAARTLS
jgi:pimeloyl-ACP methyl ester carboxylesterase